MQNKLYVIADGLTFSSSIVLCLTALIYLSTKGAFDGLKIMFSLFTLSKHKRKEQEVKVINYLPPLLTGGCLLVASVIIVMLAN